MTLLPPPARKYLTHAIEGTPDVIEELLHNIDAEHPVWDRVIDAERFTLRAVLAHLADWEPIWLERLTRIVNEECPELPDYDEGQFAIDHDYGHSDPAETVEKFRSGREAVYHFVFHLPLEAWERKATKDGNDWTLQGWLVQIAAHDAYHLQQISEWLTRDREIGYSARD